MKPAARIVRPFALLVLWLCASSTATAGVWQTQPVPASNPGVEAETVYYRCFIRVPDNMVSPPNVVNLWADSALVSFADLPGPFTILLNGQTLAQGDSLPPEPRRRFKILKGILEKKAFNVLAVRLEKGAARTGLRVTPVVHGYHDELVLEGEWEVHAGAPDLADLRAVTNRPPRAVFTEQQFREASTLLAPNAELVRGQRLAPEDSMAKMRTPPDIAVDLLLSEPWVAQPTHFSFDARGRLWVAQYRQYPYPAGLKMISRDKYYRSVFDRVPPAPPHHDRGRDVISVHEDTNGDGVFDRHREVLTGLNMANAVLHGRGGLWVMHTPYLLFYPDANGDDIPDRDPEVRLAGFGLEDTHSIANGLAWGPDGWIYGAQGSTTTSHIRRPGVDRSDAPGVYFESCMVWRYHPETREYEIFAEGGGNNFGLEFDAEGRLYSGHNGGETRGWHFVQSGIYLKQGKDPGKFGPPTNPFAFGELPMMRSATKITRFSHHFAIAEGAALPANYLGRLFNADPLHRTIVVSERNRAGATFETRDVGFAFESDDKSVRPVFVANAPDGSMYVADFYEEYIAHGQNYQGQIDPDSGRIYRLRGKTSRLERDVNLSSKSTGELIAALSHSNKWHRQTAVRLLGERRDPAATELLKRASRLGASGRSAANTGATATAPHAHPALEALWALHQAGWLDEETALAALEHAAGPVRAWVIRLMGDRKILSENFLGAVLRLAADEPDAEVRCQIAGTARRLPARQALPLLGALIRREADVHDPFIPLLCWFALESFCDSDRASVAELFLKSSPAREGTAKEASRVASDLWKTELASEHLLPRLMRRSAAKGTRSDLVFCAQLLRAAPSDAHRQKLLASFEEAFKGRTLPPLPEELVAALADAGPGSLLLRVRRGETDAVREALELIANSNASRPERLLQIRAFGEVRQPEAVPVLLRLATSEADVELRRTALAALTRYDDAAIGREVAAVYPKLPAPLQAVAQNLLSSRTAWSEALLGLVEEGRVAAREVSPEVIERLRQHPDKRISALAAKLFPSRGVALRSEARAEIERVERVLQVRAGNPYAGEPIFEQRCGSCHQLFHKGGRIGPNLTPYQRDDLSTMLPSIVDPSAEIREGYVNYSVETKDGRSLSGFVADQDANVVVLRGFDGEDVTLPRSEIVEFKPSSMSLMPSGLLDGLSDQELRDLFAYLRIPQPISR